jgi:RNA polymerase sigma factor (sigma-70 family)
MTDATNAALEQFDHHRPRLTSIAYRMLGSTADADDAVQETWLRVARANAADIDNVAGWLTTITARVCLDILRSRNARREDPFGTVTPDPSTLRGKSPEDETELADSVSLALLVVLETLDPAERLAFVLHDMFAMRFDDIAPIVERTPAATRQLASRARRRIQGRRPNGASVNTSEHRRVVDAFFVAARGGDLDSLLVVLDPDLVLRINGSSAQPDTTTTVHGARQVAGRALHFAQPAAHLQPILVNGRPGVLVTLDGERISLMAFTISHGVITAIDALVDRERLATVTLPS